MEYNGNRMNPPLNFLIKMDCFKNTSNDIFDDQTCTIAYLDGFKLYKRIIGEPILSQKLYGGILGIFKDFKNSIGKIKVLFSSIIVLSTISEPNDIC